MKTRFLAVLLLMSWAVCAHADELSARQSHDIETMLALARQAKLAERPEWLKINLYHPVFGRQTSRVDDPSYFLAADGSHDPQAELEATIRGAFDVSMAKNSRQPKVCRWIARYQFLGRSMKELGFEYPLPHCEGFERWKSGIATHSATLVFASIYLNSPASMYGHSFIRFDSDKQGEYNRLGDATIGYTVGGSSNDGLMFIVLSLFGGYPGTFVSAPFYMKLREYSDLENRDMWEYRTTLSSAEIDRMLAFIWEQSFTYLDYYFFDDNCALMLLATFEAGRPELNLIEQSKPWFIPLDIVKLVRRQPGLVEEVHYRPSQFNTLQENFYRAPEMLRQRSVALLEHHDAEVLSGLDKQDQATVMDLTLGMLEHQRNRKNSEAEAAPVSQYQLQLAGLRSKNDAASAYRSATRPANSPDDGHDSLRAGVAWGHVGAGDYKQINLRGGYHDELDPESGFATGARSKMGDLYLRTSNDQVQLERLDLFDVFSPSVLTEWFSQPTVRLNVGFRREVLQDNRLSPAAFHVEVGAGASYRWGESARAYTLLDSVTRLAGGISSMAVGPAVGVVWSVTPSLRMEVSADSHWYAFGELAQLRVTRVSGGAAWDLFNNQNALRLNVVRQELNSVADFARDFTEVQLVYFHYY